MPAFQATGSSKPRRRQSGLQSTGAPAEPSGRRRWQCVRSVTRRTLSRAFPRERSISFCRLRTFFKIPLLRRREDSLPQPPYVVLDAAPIHGVPIQDLALRSVHRDGVQLAHRFRRLRSSVLHRLTRPTSAPFRAGQPPVSDQLCGNHPAEVPVTQFPGFLSPFRLSAFASWVILRPLGSSTFLTVGLPAVDPPDPNGVVVLHMSKTRPGRAPS